jgi:hypothetical protein
MFQKHLLNLQKVFQQFREACLKLTREKCQLFNCFRRKYGTLGILSSEGITTDPKKLRAIREWLTPKNKHKIRSFLCLCTYYRRFTSSFANVAKLLM